MGAILAEATCGAARLKRVGTSVFTDAQNFRLREAMRRHQTRSGLSRADFARALGIAPPSLSNILNGKGGAGYKTAGRFAQLTGKPLDELLGPPDEDERQPKAARDPLIDEVGTEMGADPADIEAAQRVRDLYMAAVGVPELTRELCFKLIELQRKGRLEWRFSMQLDRE